MTQKFRVWLGFFALILLSFAQGVKAQELPDFAPVEDVFVRIFAEHAQLSPDEKSHLGVEFYLPEGWHVYWKNPGDSGLPPKVKSSHADVVLGAIEYAAPERFVAFDVVGYGYHKATLMTVPVEIKNVLQDVVSADISVDFLMCKDICIPGSFTHNVAWKRGDVSIENKAAAELLAAYSPPPVLHYTAEVRGVDEGYMLTVVGQEVAAFIPARDGMIDDTFLPEGRDGGLYVRADTWADEMPTALSGLVTLADGQTYVLEETDIVAIEGRDFGTSALLLTLIAAFVAGVILNLMPCVLPILALKVLAFTRPNATPHAGAYTFGILAGFWAIAGVISALQVAGSSVGWGFHLQNPVFVAILAGVMLLVGLNMLSVFYLPTPKVVANHRYGEGSGAAFMTGLLAVVVATPCTVPFMGGAVAYALTQGGFVSFAIFTALGLGLAAPFIVLAYIPAARNVFPKPGAWMETLKHVLAFPLFATALWLAWVFVNLTTVNTGFMLMALLLFISMLFWLFGVAQYKGKKLAWVWLVLAALSVFLARPLFVDKESMWQEWSDSAVENVVSHGGSAFVDITADWCVTCKFTEATVLNRRAAQAFFAENNIAIFKADWTEADPTITALLERFNRKGVPLYLVYLPDGEVKVLSQLPSLTEIKTAFGG